MNSGIRENCSSFVLHQHPKALLIPVQVPELNIYQVQALESKRSVPTEKGESFGAELRVPVVGDAWKTLLMHQGYHDVFTSIFLSHQEAKCLEGNKLSL